MISLLSRATRRRRREREHRRRLGEMLDLEHAIDAPVPDWVEAMAAQLVEIRMLPEVIHPRS